MWTQNYLIITDLEANIQKRAKKNLNCNLFFSCFHIRLELFLQ